MINSEKYIGKEYPLKTGVTAKIISYKGAKNLDVLLSNGIILKKITLDNLIKKQVANPLEKTVFGVGFTGVVNNHPLRKKAYSIWFSMMERCYGGKQINYIDCSVSEKWHDFSVFQEWYIKNYFKGCCIDKDLKIKGNKVYSESTCILVPKEINNLIINNKRKKNHVIGVRKCYNKFVATFENTYLGIFENYFDAFLKYKNTRESFIKEIAILYYSNGLIGLQCYESLNNWTIDIND